MFSLFRKKKPIEVPLEISKTTISIKYTYEWKDEIPEEQRDTKEFPSRPFCKKLLELKRLYSRADIESLSLRLGYSVFDRCGGDDCRHYWKSTIAVKKDGNK